MLKAVSGFSRAGKNGLFINSCFSHCQTERQDTWFAQDSPHIGNKVCPVALIIVLSYTSWYREITQFIYAGDSKVCGELVL